MMRVVALLLMLLAVPATAQQRVTEAPGHDAYIRQVTLAAGRVWTGDGAGKV